MLQSCYKEKYENELVKNQNIEEKNFVLNDSISALKNNNINLEDSITKLNEKINRLNNKISARNKTKYIWTLITYERPKRNSPDEYERMLYYTGVDKIEEYSDSKKYKIQDDLEFKLKEDEDRRITWADIAHITPKIKILKRETFIFDKYDEASLHRYNYLN